MPNLYLYYTLVHIPCWCVWRECFYLWILSFVVISVGVLFVDFEAVTVTSFFLLGELWGPYLLVYCPQP
jgi:hypothetical protein